MSMSATWEASRPSLPPQVAAAQELRRTRPPGRTGCCSATRSGAVRGGRPRGRRRGRRSAASRTRRSPRAWRRTCRGRRARVTRDEVRGVVSSAAGVSRGRRRIAHNQDGGAGTRRASGPSRAARGDRVRAERDRRRALLLAALQFVRPRRRRGTGARSGVAAASMAFGKFSQKCGRDGPGVPPVARSDRGGDGRGPLAAAPSPQAIAAEASAGPRRVRIRGSGCSSVLPPLESW